MSRHLHVAAAQIHSGGTVAETLERAQKQITAAANVGADLILFAEGALHGYDYDMTVDIVGNAAQHVDDPDCLAVSKMAQEAGLVVLIGFFERDGDQFYNSMLVANPDGTRWTARKHVLTPGEKNGGLSKGPKQRPIVTVNDVRCAIVICADCSIDGLYEDLAARDVDYRLCPTGGGGKIADMLHEGDLQTEAGRKAYTENRPRVFLTDAILDEETCPFSGFTAANALGPVGIQTCHQGHCTITDKQRVVRAQIPGTIVLEHMQDQMIHAELTF